MGIVLKHVVRTKAGTWHYRRRLPKDVAKAIGKGEFKRLLGETQTEALRNYPKVNAGFERLVAEARMRAVGLPPEATRLDVHREAEKWARELAQISVYVGGQTLVGSEPDAAELIRDTMLSDYPVDPETGEPVGVPDLKARALALLTNQGKLKRPAPTIEDARKLYLDDNVKGDINERARTLRVDRVVRHLEAASVEKTRPLASLTREDGRSFKDYVLRDLGMNPATARRYLNDVRAMINYGIEKPT